ncbi:MAG: type I methionyl aminopeptidase [Planctomycetota bacterium]
MARVPTVSAADAESAYAAAQKVVEIHHALAEFLEPGVTLGRIDQQVLMLLDRLGCKSCFFGYRAGGQMPPFPSQSCLSVNACVVHGTAGYYAKPLTPGDVLSIDIGVSYRGWIGDAAWTYVFGDMSDEVKRLTDAGKDSLAAGVKTLSPGRPLRDFAEAVQGVVERDRGLHLVRGLGGHGYGRKLHTPPHVSNVVPTRSGEWSDEMVPCVNGMLLAVEPMVAVGTPDTAQEGRRTWPIFTADGSMSVHYEHDVLVTDNGPRVLTEGLEQVRDVVPC